MRDFYSAPSGQAFAVFDQEAVLVEDGFPNRDDADDRVVQLQEDEDRRAPRRTTRAADLALIADHHGAHAFTDEVMMGRVFRRFGWAMLTDEAIEMLAEAYEVHHATRERMNAENRRLHAQRVATAAEARS